MEKAAHLEADHAVGPVPVPVVDPDEVLFGAVGLLVKSAHVGHVRQGHGHGQARSGLVGGQVERNPVPGQHGSAELLDLGHLEVAGVKDHLHRKP